LALKGRPERREEEMAQQRGFRTVNLDLPKSGETSVYTSARVADALQEVTADMTLYEGVRLLQIMEAVYLQGKKDGARDAFEQIDISLSAIKNALPHRRPGRPKGSRNTRRPKTIQRRTKRRKTLSGKASVQKGTRRK
jgi:hypothetical protein